MNIIKLIIVSGFPLVSSCENVKQDAHLKVVNIIHENNIHPEQVYESSEYPEIIDSLGAQKLYDKTKWILYSIHCDDTLDFKKKSRINDTITFASLDLRFDTLILKHDSLEINFRFYYKNTLCDYNLVENFIDWGALYILPSDSVIFLSSEDQVRYSWSSDPDERYKNSAHPEVVKYISTNKSKLNPWFLEEAKRRGLIK